MNDLPSPDSFSHFIGKKWDVDVKEDDLRAIGTFGDLRVITPTTICILNFVTNRLNVHIDEDATINNFNFN
jgi:hypothetical protein